MTSERKRDSWSFKPPLIVALAVLIAVVLGLVIKSTRGEQDEGKTKATYTVTRGPLDIVIKQTGELQTKNPTRIVVEISGEATISELADEGKHVKKGDLLVKLDSSQQEERLANQEIQVENARSQLVRAEEDKKIQELNNKTTISSAELEVANAGRAREKYGDVPLTEDGFLDDAVYAGEGAPQKGEAYQAFRDAELEIDRAKTELTRAERDFEGMYDLWKDKGFITENDYKDAELKVLEANRRLESAYLKHTLLRIYNYPSKIAELDAAVERAESKLKESELSTASQMVQKEAAITRYKLTYEKQQERLKELQDEISKMTMLAPEDGLVLYGQESRPWERDQIQIGAQVRRGQVIITMPRVSEMMAATRVLERDINKVAEKQKALVRIPALQNMELSGEVTKVASVADSGRRWYSSSESKSFEVQVALEMTDERMKPGMSCDVEIMVEHLESAIYVPVNAVFKDEGRDICYVASAEGIESREVKVGRSNDIYVEITEGLSEGEEVYLYSVAADVKVHAAAESAAEASGQRPEAQAEAGAEAQAEPVSEEQVEAAAAAEEGGEKEAAPSAETQEEAGAEAQSKETAETGDESASKGDAEEATGSKGETSTETRANE